jgi:hypothetical protein
MGRLLHIFRNLAREILEMTLVDGLVFLFCAIVALAIALLLFADDDED